MGRRAWTFSASFAVLGAALCWWSLRSHDPSLPDAPPPVAAGAPSPRTASALGDHVGDHAGDRTGELAVDAPARVEPVAPAPEGSVQVRVLGADGAPVAGAIVHHGDPRELSPADRVHRFDVEQRLKDLGTPTRTDGEGIARWPAQRQEKRYWQVVARAAEQFGELWIAKDAPASDVHVLQLRADVRALVRVLDAQHRPVADVPVCATYPGKGERPYTGRQPLGVSDAAGEVVLHHLQLWSEQVEPRGSVLPAMLGLELPGVPPAREIDAARPPAEAIVLFLPPTGAIDVIAIDAYGKPRAKERVTVTREDAVVRDAATATTDAGGTATFARVGLGHSWHVGFDMLDPKGWRLVVGPKVADERVTVRFQPDAGPMLTGRLLRDGAPATSTAVSVDIADATAGAGRPSTDGEGRFRIALAAAWLGRRVDAMHFATGEERGTWRGSIVLTAGDHDVGDVVLLPLPVIVGGTLVGPGGAVSQHARLAIQHAPANDGAWQWAKVSLPRKSDGTFVARGEAPAGALRVVVFGTGFAPVAPVPFVAGARDLRVELRAGGSLRATVRVGSPIAGHCMEPLLVPTDTATSVNVLLPFSLDLDSRVPAERTFVKDEPLTEQWTWPALAPGRYRLEVRLRGQREPSLVVDDLVIADGERNEDPRCQDMAIAGLQMIHITVPQASAVERSSPTAGGGFVFVLDGDEPTARCVQLDGPIAFFAVTRPLDVLVRVPGCRDKVVRGLTADTTVELEPGIPVVLRSSGQAPPAGEILWSLASLDDRAAAVRALIYSPACGGNLPVPFYEGTVASAAAGPDGATLRVVAPGRYRVAAKLRTAADGERALACEPAEVQVPAGGCALAVVVQ